MANYLFLFRGGDMRSMSPQQRQESMSKWTAWISDLSSKGHFKGVTRWPRAGESCAARSKR